LVQIKSRLPFRYLNSSYIIVTSAFTVVTPGYISVLLTGNRFKKLEHNS